MHQAGAVPRDLQSFLKGFNANLIQNFTRCKSHSFYCVVVFCRQQLLYSHRLMKPFLHDQYYQAVIFQSGTHTVYISAKPPTFAPHPKNKAVSYGTTTQKKWLSNPNGYFSAYILSLSLILIYIYQWLMLRDSKKYVALKTRSCCCLLVTSFSSFQHLFLFEILIPCYDRTEEGSAGRTPK